MPDTILIIDFGSQVTQLIARRLREKSIYTEILPSSVLDTTDIATHLAGKKGVILSG
ncbi:MAG: GMP synthase (glutamine-hydrolyzing), partial [Alphaproteobacteria bacterium]|nr:GMP synthase (glutamine-hydrolyzing) [Alphaproteobacteria bacterium]